MEAITTTNQNTIEAPKLSGKLYAEYIAYIDRSEQTTRTYLNTLKVFATWCKDNGIDRPTRDDIISYRQYLERTRSASTVAQYLRSVCQFFRWTGAAGYYPNVAENVHAPKVRTNIHKRDALDPEDVTKIDEMLLARIAGAKSATEDLQAKRTRAIFLLAVVAGLRTVEIHRANIRDLETRGGRGGRAWLYIWGKGHAEPDERKPLARTVYAAIKAYLDARTDHMVQSSPLFVATGNRSGGKRIAATTISTMLKRTLQAAGYDSERLTAHSLRHTAGTAAFTVSSDLYAVQGYLRHKDPAVTEIYLHAITERQEAELAEQICNLYKIK